MTGFAREDGGDDHVAWSWEVRSVNGRSLDVRLRLAQGFESLEPVVRTAIGKRFRRGSVSCSLIVDRRAAAADIRINQYLLEKVLALPATLGDRVSQAPPRIETLLAIRGMVEPGDETAGDDVARTAAMLSMSWRRHARPKGRGWAIS